MPGLVHAGRCSRGHQSIDVHNFEQGPDREAREHGGPSFGPYLRAGADEYVDTPGELVPVVQLYAEGENFADPRELRELAAQVLAAAEWIEEHGGSGPRS